MFVKKTNKLVKILLLILFIESVFFSIKYPNQKSTLKVDIKNYNPKKPIVIMVDLETSLMQVFQENKVLKTYVVSGGKPSTPSPIGVWTVISKDTWGEGFGGRWMGFNVPWGKYGIHGTIYPDSIGWNSSHGCIRMRNKEVAELYKITPHGTKVIIKGGPFGNFGSYLRTIKPGMRGSDIYELQKMLKEKGYYYGNPDGIYGEGMKSIIHKFQKDNKLPIVDTIEGSLYKKLGVKLID
ncbi:L,D-transpeptidase family protein [Haloimpatiens sp. FM7315]|uniref:L,D-transpeptidase family protein n=1 Tax=Haloimpatiens sp. FM7315 TaxID=3298609 RepID=UPI00370BE553